MSRWLEKLLGENGFATSILLASLFFGQVGIVPDLITAWAGDPKGCSHSICPCEAVADVADNRTQIDREASCPGEDSDERCPPDCADCSCCPGTIVAFALGLAPCPVPPSGNAVLTMISEELAAGVPGRTFRPPRPSLV